MNAKKVICAALVTTAIFTSCGEKAASDKDSPSFSQSVVININNEEVYKENDLRSPEEMTEIFNKLSEAHLDKVDKETRYIIIELKYSLDQAEDSLIDSYLGVSLEHRFGWTHLAMTNDPNWHEVPNELRPSYDVAIGEIRERCNKTFGVWWDRKKSAEQATADQRTARSE